ncbi:MAG TPA: SMP-30/gluconolactonase/LRE family protein [Allosphingosinicella sp.]|jgi:sugar lactone lactonase YvrE
MDEDKTARCIADVKAVLGEGPVWVEREQSLYWVDIKGRRIFRYALEGGELTEWPAPFRICSLAPRAEGGFIAGTEDGFAFVDPAANRFGLQFDPEPERATNRFNDGKLDRAGRFWAGTMDDAEVEASGALYRLSPGAAPVRVDDGYKVTNGPAFSPDGRLMYHNDSALQTTYVFDLDEAGEASGRRVFLSFGEGDGYPDGMTVDAEGCLWIAFWDGWCLRRYAPSGELLQHYELPVQKPTSCAFGGPGLDHLFVTSASIGLDEKALAGQPEAGGLFLLMPGVKGLADGLFAG